MKRRILVLVAAATAFIVAACSGGTKAPASTVAIVSPGGSHAPVTINVWDYYTERELSQLSDVIKQFNQQYPWIKVNLVPGKSFNQDVTGIESGQPIDVVVDAGPDDVGKYCSTGALVNLAPYIQASGLNMQSTFTPGALSYTSYKGTQCSLPLLTDAYGLYYNKTMFANAGITSPPKTLTEFAQDAQKLTVRNPDGSLKVAGFDPLSGFYEDPNLYDGLAWGAKWYDANGNSAFGSDPAWAQMLQWQKSLINYMGYQNLLKLYSTSGGANSEWDAQNAFETGKVAMLFDGEWRTASIAADGAKINYGTAPTPVADNHPELYGAGRVGGTVMGISRTAQHPAEAWAFLSFLATNTKSLTTLANLLMNVPSTYDSLKDPVLANDPHFKTFLDIFKNQYSHFYELTPAGTVAPDALTQFMQKWEAGTVPDLQQGLQQLAQTVDQQSQLGG
jgi:multiple sugar transport system substrate-binding protein